MLEFMDYVQQAFYKASNWNYENNYSTLTATARALLDFETPGGIRLNVSSLSSPNFATSYNLGSVGMVDGSLSYLYTSRHLHIPAQSSKIDIHDLIRGYRQIQELRKPEDSWARQEWQGGRRVDSKDTLLYGRLYLPMSTLEALYLRRLTPTQQLKLSAVSDSRLKNGGTILALHQYDVEKFSVDTLYSTDGGLFGVRGLYNFGPDPRKEIIVPQKTEDKFYGRFSAGAEMYYGLLNKSGGASFGVRFATLPAHKGIPLTATVTVNPLMGSLSTTYAVKAGRDLAMCTKFDFNVYSYESDFMVGCELWRMRTKKAPKRERSMAAKLAWKLDEFIETPDGEKEEVAGILKARIDQNFKVGLLWEGRIKEIMFTLGSSIDMRRREQPFRAIGLELQYSS